jgi:hypothetical protein
MTRNTTGRDDWMFSMSPRNFLTVVALILTALFPLVSRGADPLGPQITKVDPPNWWAGMPKPMLLVALGLYSTTRFHHRVDHARVRKPE